VFYIGSYGLVSIGMAVAWGVLWVWQGINQLIGKQVYRDHPPVPDRLLNAGAVFCSVLIVAEPIWARHGLWPITPAGVAAGCIVTLVLLVLTLRVSTVLAEGLTPQVVGQTPNDIVAVGPYAVVRHPMYVLTSLAGWATALTFARGGALAAACGMTLCHIGLAIREERKLARRSKRLFEIYRSRVPMFIPSLRFGRPQVADRPPASESSHSLFEKKPAGRAAAGRKG
jgi:protein-S-isoprenylcysteine O-methyltransferase Ste14